MVFKEVKNLKWFYPLKQNEYFTPSEKNINTKIEPNPFVYWNVLPYLERVSKQKGNDLEYANELLNIIKKLFDFVYEKDLKDKSFFLLKSAVEIVCNISNNILL